MANAKKVLKFLLGIAVFPVCIASSLVFYNEISSIKAVSYLTHRYFLIGIIAYLIVHAVIFKPAYLYIFGHELMHVLATWISGGKVTSFRVSSQGGSVGTTKSNFFIALAPYFFPFYTIVVAVLFFVLKKAFGSELPYNIFLFLIGFTLCFHILLTIDFLKIRQSDLLHAGHFFSICLIYIINILIVGLIFSALFDGTRFLEFAKAISLMSRDIYVGIFRQLFL